MKFLLPQGIGDSVWALHKVRSVAKAHNADKIEVSLNCWDSNTIEVRALNFVKRFSFVDDASMLKILIHPPGEYVDADGHYIYIPDGWTRCGEENYFVLMPNAPLERGIRLENWLDEYPIGWDTPERFQFEPSETFMAEAFHQSLNQDYCVFYLGPMGGNTGEGHNRGPIWTPNEWILLGGLIQNQLNLRVVVVGASYDLDYFNHFIEVPLLKSRQIDWINMIGRLEIASTYAVVKNARFVVSYQSGIGIFASYLGVPTAIFWRPKGDSVSPRDYISFEEEMASAWTRPDMISSGKHMPLIYGRHGVEYILSEIQKRNW